MSQDGESVVGQIPPRLLLFIIFLIVSGPFMLYGGYKNGQIESCLEASDKCMEKNDYLGAEKQMNEAGDHFGLLYDIYVIMPTFGGKYYRKDDVLGLRGVTRTTAIAQRMGNGEADVEELMKEATADVEQRGSFAGKSAPLREIARKQMAALKKLLPLLKACKSGDFEKAYKDFQTFITNKDNLQYEVILMPVCRIAYELACNAPSRRIGEGMVAIIRIGAEESDNPFFKNLQREATMIDFDAPRSTARQTVASSRKEEPKEAPARPKKPEKPEKPETSETSKAGATLEEKFANGLALARSKEFNKALPLIEQCYRERPDNDKICYTLALIHKNLGKNDDARRICEEMLQRNPANSQAQKLLASVK